WPASASAPMSRCACPQSCSPRAWSRSRRRWAGPGTSARSCRRPARGWWCKAKRTRSSTRKRSTPGRRPCRGRPRSCAWRAPAISSTAGGSACAERSGTASATGCRRRAPRMADGDLALPSQRHAAGVARGEWQDDPAQHAVLRELDRIHMAIAEAPEPGLLGRLLGRRPAPPRGLYLWGGVGRGKTFLVDLFFAGLPTPRKRRTHFHRFMRDVHAQLREHAGERDPLARIARQWREQLQVLVLDEFFVSDIG